MTQSKCGGDSLNFFWEKYSLQPFLASVGDLLGRGTHRETIKQVTGSSVLMFEACIQMIINHALLMANLYKLFCYLSLVYKIMCTCYFNVKHNCIIYMYTCILTGQQVAGSGVLRWVYEHWFTVWPENSEVSEKWGKEHVILLFIF